VTDWVGDPAAVLNFQTRFTAMVVVPSSGGATVTVSGKVAEKLEGNMVRLELQSESAGNVVASAEALVRLS
jgi:hypothetical protein